MAPSSARPTTCEAFGFSTSAACATGTPVRPRRVSEWAIRAASSKSPASSRRKLDMNRIVRRPGGVALLLGSLVAWLVCASVARAQFRQEPGRSIGTISTQGNLIVMTLNEGVLGKPNLFDLAHRTLRFIPD